MRMQIRILALWACLASLAGSATAQVYTWTDSNGKKHFGDAATRPRDKISPEIKMPPANVADRFEVRNSPEPTSTQAPPVDSAPAPATAPSTRPLNASRPSSVDRSRNSCKAKWVAFESAVSCYDACAKPMAPFRGRNNAECGHCQDLPMPNC